MAEPHVVTEIEGPIAHVWLNRPEKLNGITFDVLDGLMDAADRIEADPNVRAVILEGRGPSFCAGLDFAQVMTDKKRVTKYFLPNPVKGTNRFQQPLWAWRELSVPVIAVTRGHVFGGGIQLALAADFRFTTPDCQWSILEAKWGLVPDMSGTVALAELVGADLAKRLTMTGEIFSGEKAVEYGIASGVADDPAKPALELVDQLIARSPDSVAASKRLLNETRRATPRRAFALERKLQKAMFKSPNTAIAREAGMTKSQPEFGPRTFGR
ncbi:crotonase/enoyl-CoA hydratase family protein [Aeromicrobium sp. 179-A 4D2 NHS]|uniref:crotonase/enoyl-CoA hydratase family protein n=1 Tax=Aeromicrobium sp. 179-A 4D2 NHS TaxID=3142375 RepID=UPI0039A10667